MAPASPLCCSSAGRGIAQLQALSHERLGIVTRHSLRKVETEHAGVVRLIGKEAAGCECLKPAFMRGRHGHAGSHREFLEILVGDLQPDKEIRANALDIWQRCDLRDGVVVQTQARSFRRRLSGLRRLSGDGLTAA
jgi:hypothetical protein